MNAKETETVNEKIYQIIMITEADYGCEECPPEGPAALVLLRSDDGEQRRMEVPEAVPAVPIPETQTMRSLGSR